MNRWLVASIACIAVALALLGVISQTAPRPIEEASSSLQALPTQALSSEAEVRARIIDHLQKAGIREDIRVVSARPLSLYEAVRAVAKNARLDRGLIEAGVGQPGRERDRQVWLVDVVTSNPHFPNLLYILDARTGDVLDWPTPPSFLTLPAPSASDVSSPNMAQRPTLTREEDLARGYAAKATTDARIKSGELKPIPLSGLETMGSTISVGGKLVKLPPDAYVASFIVSGICAEAPCPRLPAQVLSRGNATILIDAEGQLWDEQFAKGEEHAFDFLKEALR